MGYYDGLGAFVGFMLVIVIISALVALAVVVVNIVFFCIGLKKMHYDKWWLAIIPFCTPYAVIDCTGEPEAEVVPGKVFQTSMLRWVSVALPFLQGFMTVIPFIGGIAALALLVCQVLVLGWGYKVMYAKLKRGKMSDYALPAYVSTIFNPIAWFMFATGSEVDDNRYDSYGGSQDYGNGSQYYDTNNQYYDNGGSGGYGY